MTKLRKEKEAEIFREFQRHQQHMSDLLQTQQQEATSDEDQRIAQAVAEQHAKRDVRHAVLLSVHISIWCVGAEVPVVEHCSTTIIMSTDPYN